MNTTQFMPDATEQERLQVLQDTAIKVRNENYSAPLSKEEVANREREFYKNAIKIKDLQAEKKEMTKDISDQIKAIELIKNNLHSEIHSEKATKDGILYEVPNYESGDLETYDKNGDLIELRKLTPFEKKGIVKQGNQSKLFIPDAGFSKTGSE